MAECPEGASGTVTVTEETSESPSQQRLVLKLNKPKSEKKVQWDESAVDNEFMGKKTSKCYQTSVTVTDNSPFQDYPHPDDHTTQSTISPGFKHFTVLDKQGCCIYSKPKMFGDSSSESDSDDDGCNHNAYCTGHKKKGHHGHHHDHRDKGDGPAGLNENPGAS